MAGTAASVPFAALAALDPAGWRVTKGEGLFPRPVADTGTKA